MKQSNNAAATETATVQLDTWNKAQGTWDTVYGDVELVAETVEPDAETETETSVAGNKVYSPPATREKSRGRDEKGRILPGFSGNPKGRPPRAAELALHDAVVSVLGPDEVKVWLRKALKIAEEQNSSRGITSVISLAMAYALGKPTQRIGSADGPAPEDWLNALLDDANDD